MAMEAIPEQPVLSATAPVQEPPVSAPAPVPPERTTVAAPQSVPESALVAQEGPSESSPESALAAQQGPSESSPESALAAQQGPSESSPVSVPEALECASNSVPEPVLASPELVSQECTLSACAVMAPEFVPRSFTSQELVREAAKTSPKTPPVRRAHVPRRTTNQIPIPPSLLPSPFGSPKPEPPWLNSNYPPKSFSSLPVPPPMFPGYPGVPSFVPRLPPQLVPPCTVWPSVDAWRQPLGGGYCQDPALTVLSLFNVCLFVLCLSTWFCLCLCLPCAPLVPPPCFAWSRPLVQSLSSPRLLDCVHLILMCSAALYCVPSPCVFAGSFWCLPVSWS